MGGRRVYQRAEGAGRVEQRQRDDLPARQPARLRALGLGRRDGDWDHAHCLPYFKRMENCLAAAPDDPFRGHRGRWCWSAARAGAAVRGVLRRGAGGGLPAHRRRERVPPGGLRGVRSQRARRAPAVGGAGVPASGDEAAEPCVETFALARILFEGGRAVGSSTAAAAGGAPGEVMLCGGAINSPQLLQISGVGAADELRGFGIDVVADLPGVGENLQDHLEVYVQHSARSRCRWRPTSRCGTGRGWAAVAAAQDRAGRDQPLRGGRLRARQRRGEVPEPDVPLPADRGALRRHAAAGRGRARLPGARGADVLGRAGDLKTMSADPRPAGAAVQLPVDGERPARVGRGDPVTRKILAQPAWRSWTVGAVTRAPRSRPTSRS